MRLFLALDVSLAQLDLKKLKINLNQGKNFQHQWIPDKQRHIPLFNLTDMGREKVSDVKTSLESRLQDMATFELKLSGVWAYPKQEQARVLWIGVQNSRELRAFRDHLMGDLSDYLTSQLEEESIYRPYLPVVRLRNYRSVTDIISPYKNADFGMVKIDKVMLYEMVSGGAFPKYREEAAFSLQDLNSDLEDLNHLGG